MCTAVFGQISFAALSLCLLGLEDFCVCCCCSSLLVWGAFYMRQETRKKENQDIKKKKNAVLFVDISFQFCFWYLFSSSSLIQSCPHNELFSFVYVWGVGGGCWRFVSLLHFSSSFYWNFDCPAFDSFVFIEILNNYRMSSSVMDA